MGGQKFIHILHCDFGSALLVFSYEFLKNLDENFFDFSWEHLSTFIVLSDLLQFLIIFQEKHQVVICNVYF